MRRTFSALLAASSFYVSFFCANGFMRSGNSAVARLQVSCFAKGFGKPDPNKKQQQQKDKVAKPDPSVLPTTGDLFSQLNPSAQTSASKLNPRVMTDPATGEQTVNYANPKVGDFQVFDSLICYPTDFQIKVIGDGRDNFVEDMVKLAAEATNMRPELVTHSTKESGKWTSVTLNLYVTSSDQLYKAYEEIDKDPRVRFKF
mmetsp:Transcript_31609/g.51538  ORF Transcript_31609/g.51538 Transcript_31609/m.51538 type:complete len:201 (+) Transcript_31609:23-625(+)